jgi:hypothetical protein
MKKTLLSVLFCTTLASATPVVTLSLVGPGTPAVVDTQSNDYVGPYALTLNGQTIAAMCMDDFNVVSGTWTAAVTQANGSDLGNTYLGNNTFNVSGYQFTSAQVYQAEAYLFSKLIEPNADRVDLQDAAWTIMDEVTGHTPHSNGNAAVDSIISDVVANASSFHASGYEILSEVQPGSSAEQEFMTAAAVTTTEPATLAAVGLALLVAGAIRVRRNLRKVPSASQGVHASKTCLPE